MGVFSGDTSSQLMVYIGGDSAGLLQQLNSAQKTLDDFGKNAIASAKKIGEGMMVAGGAIVGALGLAAHAAEDERLSQARLAIELKNVGVSYDEVSKSLEANISATMKKTGFSDSEQRDALSNLVLVTGDYKRSLDLLPLALDLAAAKQMDVSTAATLLGRVADGNTSALTRYGIVLDKNATSSDALAAIQAKVGGSAEAMVSPFKVLTGEMDQLAEKVGHSVLPALTAFVDKTINVVTNLGNWASAHETLIKWVGGLGLALLGAGGLVFGIAKTIEIVQSMIKAFEAARLAMILFLSTTGPAGWATLAAGVAVAAAAIYGFNQLSKDNSQNIDQNTQSLYDYNDAAAATVDVNANLAAAFATVAAGGTGANKVLDFTKMTMSDMESYAKSLMGTVMTFEQWNQQSNSTAFTNAYGTGWLTDQDEKKWLLDTYGVSWDMASADQLAAADAHFNPGVTNGTFSTAISRQIGSGGFIAGNGGPGGPTFDPNTGALLNNPGSTGINGAGAFGLAPGNMSTPDLNLKVVLQVDGQQITNVVSSIQNDQAGLQGA